MSRVFADFRAAVGELRRDLAELSVELPATTWQGRSVAGDPGFNTKELTNYLYTVTNPDTSIGLNPTQPWADAEFGERVNDDMYINPGEAYKLRSEVWDELIESTDHFSYTYNERIRHNLREVIFTLQDHPQSRQLYLSIWNPSIDAFRLEKRRVPCSLGYYFQYRHGRLDMTYLQRSCDFATHYDNDVYLAVKLLSYVCEQTHRELGYFSHWIGSLHVFAKDVENVF